MHITMKKSFCREKQKADYNCFGRSWYTPEYLFIFIYDINVYIKLVQKAHTRRIRNLERIQSILSYQYGFLL